MASTLHRHRARKNFFNRLRRLAPWRSRTRLGRATAVLLSMLLALMMLGTAGPAYAEGTAPDESAPEVATLAAEEEPVAGEEAAPEESQTTQRSGQDPTQETEGAEGSPDATGEGDAPADSTNEQAGRTSLLAVNEVLAAVSVSCVPGSDDVVGGFEIDGDLCVETDLDWDSEAGDREDDKFGEDDTTRIGSGSSENTDPATWRSGPIANGKSDIGMTYAFSHAVSGNVFAYFALTNASTSGGSGQYDVEYNQLPNKMNENGLSVPQRSPGDLLFRFTSTGSAPLTFDDVKEYRLKSDPEWDDSKCFTTGVTPAAGWCTVPMVANSFMSATNSDGTFFEGAINLSKLFPTAGGDCTGTFGTTNIRSVTGGPESFATSSIKDIVKPLEVNTPSTCGSLKIEKKALTGNTLLPGAIYAINDDPRPGKTGTYLVFDGTAAQLGALQPPAPTGTVADGSADGMVNINPAEPDNYTVTERRAPAGYLLPEDVDQQVTVGQAGSDTANRTITFRDPRKWAPLQVEKTADASYKASYAWTIDKQVAEESTGPWTDAGVETDSEQINGSGPSGEFHYRVAVTAGKRTASDHKVTGNIRVKNPNPDAVSVNLSDSLPGATCVVTGGNTKSVPGTPQGQTPAFHDYAYTCTFAGTPTQEQLEGDNTATVTWDRSDYPQEQGDVGKDGVHEATATDGYDFTAAGAETVSTNKTIRVSDDKGGFSPNPATVSWTSEGAVTVVGAYSRTIGADVGKCSPVDTNTAEIVETGQKDRATAEYCRGADLKVSKGATGELERTYPWSVKKSTSTPRVDVDENGKATASYKVTVTAGDQIDADWHMNGTIEVENPNDWQAVALTGLTDTYSGGGTCTITGVRDAGTSDAFVPVDVVGYSIPAGDTEEFSYDCTFGPNGPSTYTGTNTATATWDADAAATPTDTADDSFILKNGDAETDLSDTNDWKKRLVNDTVTVTDDNATPKDTADDTTWELTWADVYKLPKHEWVEDYTIDLPVPDSGTCAPYENTVKVTGDNGANLDADDNPETNSATVQVCNPTGLTATKDADPLFTRTYDWKIGKEVRISPDGAWQDDKASWTGDAFSKDFDYRLTVSRNGFDDSTYAVTGKITVTNPNTDDDIAPIEATITEPSTFGGVAATCVIDDKDPATTDGTSATVTLVSGDSVTLDYRCSLAGKPAAGTANEATITWGDGATTKANSAAVSFTTPTTRVNETVQVRDDVATIDLLDDKAFGPLDWDDAADPVVYGPYKVTHTATTTGCAGNSWTNTATVYGDTWAVLDTNKATAEICPDPATWTVQKDSDPADGSRIEPGTAITYTLAVKHTGGVPATGVTAVDDLSGLLPDHATFTGLHADSQGENVTAPTAGNGYELTWDAGDLAIGATKTLKFVVTVHEDAWGVKLPNLVTSPGSTNCPSPTAELPEECTTDHETKEQPKLTLVKDVDDNGTGANHAPTAWDLSADGPTDITVKSGTESAVDPGTYALSENEGPGAGMYTQLGWKCDNDTEFRDPESITLVSDQVATCTVHNKAVKPRLTLVKELDKSADPGAPGEKADWNLRANHAGTEGIDLQGDGGASGAVDRVGSYALSEVRNPSVKPGWTDGTTWNCGPNAKAVTEISLSLGADVTCTITNTVSKGTWSRSKSSNPGDGATVKPGDTIVYHLTATRNPGGSDPRDIRLVDDLSDVLDHASFVGITDASGNGIETPANVDVPNGDDTTLDWDIAVLSQTEHLYYKVQVKAGEYGVDFGNVVTGAGSECLMDCETDHHTPSYSLDKSTEAPERVAPGDTLTYTLTVRNTSNAKVEGFSVTDDLAGQTYVEDPRVGGSPIPDCDATPVCLDGTDLRWSFPTLQPQGEDGDSATLTYTVKVRADAFGVDIDNLATPGPGGECIEGEDPECTTHHETKDKPRLTLVKDVDNGTTDGKAAPKDFTLTATPVDVPDAGSETQGAVSGPGGGAGQVVNRAVLPGEYELDETHVDHYTQGRWECRPTAVPGGWTPAGELGAKGAVELGLDEDVTCRVTNTADGGKYSIAKSSDQDGEEVLPGSEIAYTLTARWVDGVRMEDVVVRDDITDVLDDADLDESDLPANAVIVTEEGRTFIEWTIPLLEDSDGNRQATLTYSVTVNADAWSTTLRNVVTPVTDDGTCEEGNDCETTTTTPDLPKLALVKEMEQGVGTPTAVGTDWILSADPDAQVGGGQGTESGAGGFSSRAVWPGTYALDESDNPDSDGAVEDYSAGDWSCVDNNTQQPAFGGLTGAELELVPNDDVTCTIVNTRDPEWAVGKTNDRGDGTTVLPGQEIAYTLTVHHTAGVKPTGIVVHDDLSDVLDDATMVTTFPSAGGAVTFDERTQVLTWNVPAFEGDSTEQTFTYVVRVRDDAAGVTLVNAVTSPGSNCPPPLSLAAVLTDDEVAELDCSTSNPVPAWTLDKDSDPLSGEFVAGGEEITYRLVVTNTSDAVLEGATVVDDLSAVLGNAVLDEGSFLVDGVAPAAGDVVFDDATDTLTWQVPTIAPGGAPVELTYVVRTDDELEPGTFFENVAGPGDPTNPVNTTGRCVAEGECTTHHDTEQVDPPVEPPAEPPTGNDPPAEPPSSTVAGPLPPSGGLLPSTGGPARWLVPGALALLLAGLALVLVERRRRRVD